MHFSRVLIFISGLFFSITSYAEKKETFEVNLWDLGCDVAYEYSKENPIDSKELISIARYMALLSSEDINSEDIIPNKVYPLSEKVINGSNELIKKTFSMTGNNSLYKFQIYSGEISCGEKTN